MNVQELMNQSIQYLEGLFSKNKTKTKDGHVSSEYPEAKEKYITELKLII